MSDKIASYMGNGEEAGCFYSRAKVWSEAAVRSAIITAVEAEKEELSAQIESQGKQIAALRDALEDYAIQTSPEIMFGGPSRGLQTSCSICNAAVLVQDMTPLKHMDGCILSDTKQVAPQYEGWKSPEEVAQLQKDRDYWKKRTATYHDAMRTGWQEMVDAKEEAEERLREVQRANQELFDGAVEAKENLNSVTEAQNKLIRLAADILLSQELPSPFIDELRDYRRSIIP